MTSPLRLPGDKSLAHRALLVSALSTESTVDLVTNLPDGDDVQRTRAAVTAMRQTTSPRIIDCGNSGTLARLLMGVLAGEGIDAELVGDASLSSRPMKRVADPLRALFGGDVVELSATGTLPARITPRPPRSGAIVVDTLVPSAQVKSALLLAARRFTGSVCVREPTPTRDHTERMLRALGADVVDGTHGNIAGSTIACPSTWRAYRGALPGDPSSAALLAAYAIVAQKALVVDDVLLNERRTGFFRVAAAMGAPIETRVVGARVGEPVGTLSVSPSSSSSRSMRSIDVGAGEITDMIDEVPALVALAMFAAGTTTIEGVGELRVKESDRVARLVDMVRAFGGRADDDVDRQRLVIEGGTTAAPGKVHVRTDGDHRIAMAAHVVARALDVDLVLDEPGCERTSFPSFLTFLDTIR